MTLASPEILNNLCYKAKCGVRHQICSSRKLNLVEVINCQLEAKHPSGESVMFPFIVLPFLQVFTWSPSI